MTALSKTPSVSGGQEAASSSRRDRLFRRSPPGLLTPLWDRIATIDPGLLRLLLATRGTLSVALTAATLVALSYATGRPILQFAPGVVLSMVGPFVMRDPTPAQRLSTLLWLLPPSAVAVSAASLAALHPPAGEVWFLLLVFVTALLQPRHPRALGMGLIAVVMTYVGLYLHLPLEVLPIELGALVVAAIVVWLVCLVLLPVRPARTLRRIVRSVRRRAGRILQEAENARDTQRSATLRRHLVGLNTAALAGEDQLGLLDEAARIDVRLHLFDLERAATLVIDLVSDGDMTERHWDRLRVLAERLRRGRESPRASLPGASGDPLHDALLALARASAGLERAASRAVAASAAPAAAPPPAPGPYGWRVAVQVTLASLIAMVGGMALSPQRWFWAVIAVYVVFLNTRSRGDAIYKGSHRIVGTLAGLFGGVLITTLVGDNGLVQCVIMLAAVFGIFYLYSVSYALAIFCVTVLLGMIYGSMNVPLGSLLWLRFEETAIGVVAGALAASFVWPLPTKHQVRLSGLEVLRALKEVVRASVAAVEGNAEVQPIEAVRRLDRQLADLRVALTPLNARRALLGRARAERPLTALLACAVQARKLAGLARPSAEDDAAAVRALGASVEARILAMIDGTPHSPVENAEGDSPVADALRELDQALAMLSERLKANVAGGFALD